MTKREKLNKLMIDNPKCIGIILSNIDKINDMDNEKIEKEKNDKEKENVKKKTLTKSNKAIYYWDM